MIPIPCSASFMLVAAMNPYPCGFLGDPKRECICTYPQIQRYRSKISGPLLDRIDIHVEVPSVHFKDLSSLEPGQTSEQILARVKTGTGRIPRELGKVHPPREG